MHVISLQSGSNGNCIYVEAGGVKLLFDAGISGSRAKERLAQHGRDIASVDAVLISHDHVDHSRCMGIFHRKFGLPVYVTTKTYRAASRYGLERSKTSGTLRPARLCNSDGWRWRPSPRHTTGWTAWCSWWTTANAAWVF